MECLLTSYCKYIPILLIMVYWIVFDNEWNSIQITVELQRMTRIGGRFESSLKTPRHSVSRRHISPRKFTDARETLNNLPMNSNSETHLALIERLKNESELEHRPFIVHHVRKMKKWKKTQASVKQISTKSVDTTATINTKYHTTTAVSTIKTTLEMYNTTNITSPETPATKTTSTVSNDKLSDMSTIPTHKTMTLTTSTAQYETTSKTKTKPILKTADISKFTTQDLNPKMLSTLETTKITPFAMPYETKSEILTQHTTYTYIIEKSTSRMPLRKKKRKVKNNTKRKTPKPETNFKTAKRSTKLAIPKVAILDSKEENSVFLVKSHVKHGGTKWSNNLQVIRNY